MSEAVVRMLPDAFLEWCEGREGRYELVDGVPVAMAGARRKHDRIVVNTLAALSTRLAGSPCAPFTGDSAVRIPNGNIRRPDVGIDCGPFDPNDLAVPEPRVVIEVLSPSTRAFDLLRKVHEYRRLPSLSHILMLDPDSPSAHHWTRTGPDSWREAICEGLETVIEMPDLGLSLPLATVYAGLPLTPPLRAIPQA